jgi:hypothetical protein
VLEKSHVENPIGLAERLKTMSKDMDKWEERRMKGL